MFLLVAKSFVCVTSLGFLLSTAGCGSTTAEKRLTTTVQQRDAHLQQGNLCAESLKENLEWNFISLKLSSEGKPNLSQLTDISIPSEIEAAHLVRWHSAASICRSHFLQANRTMSPGHEIVANNLYLRRDSVYAALVRREISWGAANERLSGARIESDLAFDKADSSYSAAIQDEHQQEMERRRAAAAAFAASMNQANQNLQQQQLINSINRPRTTTCNRIGTYVNCSTY